MQIVVQVAWNKMLSYKTKIICYEFYKSVFWCKRLPITGRVNYWLYPLQTEQNQDDLIKYYLIKILLDKN